MTANITLPRAVAEEAARFIDSPNTRPWPAGTQYRLWKALRTALDAALAEPDAIAELFAQFAAKQRPLDADITAIINANLDSLYITDEPAAALAEPEKERAKVAAPARNGVASSMEEIDILTPEVYCTPEPPANPEPVAFMRKCWSPDCGEYVQFHAVEEMKFTDPADWTPLYAAPPAAAKPEPATDEQLLAAYDKSDVLGFLNYRDTWREAERFHGITKEDKT
jgi:hypothetical protein